MQLFGTVSIEITSLCNLSCKHCFNRVQPLGTMRFETLKAIIEKFSMFDIPQFVISGGEPFMHPDLQNIISYVSQTPFDYILTTNGTIINHEVLELISHAPNISIQISLDGSCARIHNEQRGLGAFEQMERFCDILEKKKIKYQFHSTITKINYKDMEFICRYAIDKNVYLDMAFVSLVGNAALNREKIALTDNEKIYTYFNLKQKFENHIGIKLPKILYSCAFTNENYVICPSINSNGLVNVCNAMEDNSNIGNVLFLDLDNIKENAKLKQIEEKCKRRQTFIKHELCKDCIVKECEQGCIAKAMSLGNEFGDDGECEFRKKVEVLSNLNQLI